MTKRARFLFRAGLTVCFLHVAIWIMCPPLSAAFKKVGVGDKPPAFTLKDLKGKAWKNGDVFGKKVTVMVFWATWSPRSAEILTDLEALSAELGTERVQIVAVNVEHENISAADRETIEKLKEMLGLSALVLIDQGLVAFNDFGTMAVPSSMVVDLGGKVVFDLAGYPTTMRSDLSDAVKKALGLPTSVELRPPEEYKPKNHALMYYNFGRRLMEKGQDEKAEAQLLLAVEKDPDFVKPRVSLGVYYKRTNRFDEALAQFQAVKDLDPANSEAGYQEAAVSLKAGRFGEAEGLFQRLHEEFPAREEFALGLALTHKYQNREEDFLKIRTLAESLLPAPPRVHYEFGAVAESQGDLETAAVLYHRALDGVYKK